MQHDNDCALYLNEEEFCECDCRLAEIWSDMVEQRHIEKSRNDEKNAF